MSIAASLDTKVLVRLIVKDDVPQLQKAQKMVAQTISSGQSLFVPTTVALELEWVLRSRYQFDKADVLRALSSLLSAAELAFESEYAIEQALINYEEGAADFADYLHLALARKATALPFLTFDVRAATAQGASLLM